MSNGQHEAFPVLASALAVLVGGSSGTGLALLALEAPPPASEDAPTGQVETAPLETATATNAAETVAEPSAAPTAPVPPVAPEAVETIVEAVPSTPPPTPSESTPVVAPPPLTPTAGASSAGALHLVPGRVAYLRCDGLPQVDGPFPCMRDEALESATWTALRALETCPLTHGGEADVVLDYRARTAPEVRLRDTFRADVTRLDTGEATSCLAERFAAVMPSGTPTRLVVSFRLAMR